VLDQESPPSRTPVEGQIRADTPIGAHSTPRQEARPRASIAPPNSPPPTPVVKRPRGRPRGDTRGQAGRTATPAVRPRHEPTRIQPDRPGKRSNSGI
jgi:hypothetical protein